MPGIHVRLRVNSRSFYGSAVREVRRTGLRATIFRGACDSLAQQYGNRMLPVLSTRVGLLARQYANRRTGALAASIEARRVGGTEPTVLVGTPMSYASFVHDGTRPHLIRPRPPNRFLRFPGRDGRIVFAREVHHPGYIGNPFLESAMVETIRAL
jgi:hypothetical protein